MPRIFLLSAAMRGLPNTIIAAWCGSLWCVAGTGLETRAQSDRPTAVANATAGGEGVVVMRDGGVLIGSVKKDGYRFVVTRAGGELQVAASSVMLTATSLTDAYQKQRGQISVPTAIAHLRLAQWCLRNELWQQARQELDEARKLEPANSALALLERRLARATSRDGGAGGTNPSPAKSPWTSESDASAALPIDVSHEVVERFTRRVQPVLVNNCTTSGCHQPGGKESFQLDRALLRGLANRRSTMRNLAATLTLVDREHPEESPLLTVPRQAHGGMENPIFGPRQQHAYEHLVEWVALVAAPETAIDSSPPPAEPIAAAEQPLPSLPDVPVDEGTLVEKKGAALRAGVSPAAFKAIQRELTATPPTTTPPVRYGTQLQAWTPRDPFDAEIFNRQTEKLMRAQVETAATPTENGQDR
jgi:hypothetical protein